MITRDTNRSAGRERSVASKAETLTLGFAYSLAGAALLVVSLAPFGPTARTGVTAALGVASMVVGAVLLAMRERVPPAVHHALLGVACVRISGSIVAAASPDARVVASYGYLWVAAYSAMFHRRSLLVAYIATIAVGSALALALSAAPSPVVAWGFLMCSIVGVAAVLNTLVVRLRTIADRDQLTGVLSRGALLRTTELAMAASRRSGQPLTLALLDMNDFKQVNDLGGHAAGDALLADLGAAWRKVMHRSEVLGRYGGDEFVLLMPGVNEQQAAVELQRFKDASDVGQWTAGVAEWQGEPLAAWLHRADAHLYLNKRARRAAFGARDGCDRTSRARGSRPARTEAFDLLDARALEPALDG